MTNEINKSEGVFEFDRSYVERLIPQLMLPATGNTNEANNVRMKGAARQLRAAMAKIDDLQALLTRIGIGVSPDLIHERNMNALGYKSPVGTAGTTGDDVDPTPGEVNLDGRRDHKDYGIRYLGKAIKQPSGEYHVLADVHGSLCRVAVTIVFAVGPSSEVRRVLAYSVVTSDSSPGESFPPVAVDAPGSQGRIAIVDAGAIVQSCDRIIRDRPPRDGSPPTAVVSADVLRSIAVHVLDLHCAILSPMKDPESGRPSYAMAKRFADRGPVVGGDGAADALGSVVEPVIDWLMMRYPHGFVWGASKVSVESPVPEVGSVVVDGENSRRFISLAARATLDDYTMSNFHSSQPDIRMRACAITAGLREVDGGLAIDVEIRLVLRSLANRGVLGGAVGELVTALEKCRVQ